MCSGWKGMDGSGDVWHTQSILHISQLWGTWCWVFWGPRSEAAPSACEGCSHSICCTQTQRYAAAFCLEASEGAVLSPQWVLLVGFRGQHCRCLHQAGPPLHPK